jgi:hypothetical protein
MPAFCIVVSIIAIFGLVKFEDWTEETDRWWPYGAAAGACAIIATPGIMIAFAFTVLLLGGGLDP